MNSSGSVDQLIISKSINQSINLSITQSINQSINHSIRQSVCLWSQRGKPIHRKGIITQYTLESAHGEPRLSQRAELLRLNVDVSDDPPSDRKECIPVRRRHVQVDEIQWHGNALCQQQCRVFREFMLERLTGIRFKKLIDQTTHLRYF